MKYRENEWSNEVRYWVEHNLANFERRTNQEVLQAEHILDYLLSPAAPKRLRRMSVDEAKHNAEKWSKALAKKGNSIIETEEDIKVINNLGDGFRLVRLKTKNAYRREGSMMRHCVASYYDHDDCLIYSIRDSLNQSHCTLEVKKQDGQIYQIKGKGNGSIHPKYIKYVLKSLKIIGQKVRGSELRNLGYVNLEEDVCTGMTRFIKDNFPKAKFMTYEGDEYVYENSLK